MSNGSYDRRAPSAASQIITLERLLEESEERNAELEATIAELKVHLENLNEQDALIDKLGADNKALIDANVEVANINAGLLAKHDALEEAARAYSKNVGHSRKCTFLMVVQQQVSGKPCICGHDALAALIKE